MELSENFDQLKHQFAALGYNSPHIDNDLRQHLAEGKDDFVIYYQEDFERLTLNCRFNMHREQPGNPVKLDYYESLMDECKSSIMSSRSFDPEVTKDEACQALAKGIQFPSAQDNASPWILRSEAVRQYLAENNPQEINYFNYLNQHTMNEENVNYLKDNLKYLGFEEKLNGPMTEKMNKQAPEFQLQSQVSHFDQKVMDYTLHFKKSESTDRYFFNRYEAKLTNGEAEAEKAQTFYINKGHGVTAKEAFNLLEGRSVYKTLQTKEGEKYNVWMQLDFENKDKHGNHQVKTFHDKYNFKLERALDKYDIKELSDPEKKAELMKSMQKGNTQQVTTVVNGQEVKAFVEALPEKRSINFYNEKMKPQDTAIYLKTPVKKNLAQEKAQREEQKQAEGQSQGRKKSRGVHH